MEVIRHEGREYSVREEALFKEWSRRVLATDQGVTFLEYLVSVGPFKIDIPVVYAFSAEEAAAYKTGTLKVGELARSLSEHTMASGKYERGKP